MRGILMAPVVASAMVFTPTVSGTYTIVINLPDSSYVGGSVLLAVNEVSLPTTDDFTNALDPTGALNIWETKDAYIETSGDTDTIAINLEAGVAVDITVYGNPGRVRPSIHGLGSFEVVDD